MNQATTGLRPTSKNVQNSVTDVEKTSAVAQPTSQSFAESRGYGVTSDTIPAVNVEKTDIAAAPAVNPHAHLMKNLSKEEIHALSREEKKAYVRLNTPRWKEDALTEVTGVFKNLEHRGGSVVFNFCAYPGEDYKTWEFTDGGHYRIPRGVAIHLNDDCFYKEYQEVKGDFGQEKVQSALHNGQMKAANMQVATKVYRYAFHSLEFSRDELSISRSTLAQAYVSP